MEVCKFEKPRCQQPSGPHVNPAQLTITFTGPVGASPVMRFCSGHLLLAVWHAHITKQQQQQQPQRVGSAAAMPYSVQSQNHGCIRLHLTNAVLAEQESAMLVVCCLHRTYKHLLCPGTANSRVSTLARKPNCHSQTVVARGPQGCRSYLPALPDRLHDIE